MSRQGADKQRSHLTLVGKWEVVEHRAPKANTRDRKTALLHAVMQDQPSTLLKYIEGDHKDYQRVLTYSMWYGKLAVVQYLLEQGADKEATVCEGKNALTYAAWVGELEVVQCLLEQGADQEARDSKGTTALMWAASSGKQEVVAFLAGRGADKDARDKSGCTALIHAARDGRLDTVKCLVELGADRYVKDKHRRTALRWAQQNRHHAVATYLWEKQCMDEERKPSGLLAAIKRNLKKDSTTAAMQAACAGRLNKSSTDNCASLKSLAALVVLDEEYERKRDLELDSTLPAASMRSMGGDVSGKESASGIDELKQLVKLGMDLEQTDEYGRTALLKAAEKGELEIVEYLADHGADTDVRDCSGMTALIYAAWFGQLSVVQYLVEHVADKDAQDSDGWTAMMYAVMYDKVEVLQYLVEHGADTEIQDDFGRTVLICAASYAKLDVLRYLVEHGASTVAKDSGGRTALTWASMYGKQDVVDYLVLQDATKETKRVKEIGVLEKATPKRKPDAERCIPQHDSPTAVHAGGKLSALKYQAVEVTKSIKLTEPNASSKDKLNAMDLPIHGHHHKNGQTPLMLAASKGNLDRVKYLVEHGADHEITDDMGRTAIMHAAQSGRLDVVNYLIELGANVCGVDMEGNTVLHHLVASTEQTKFLLRRSATMEDRILPVAKLLFEYDVPLDSNDAGKTVKSIAKKKRFVHLYHLVKEYEHKRRLEQDKRLDVLASFSQAITQSTAMINE